MVAIYFLKTYECTFSDLKTVLFASYPSVLCVEELERDDKRKVVVVEEKDLTPYFSLYSAIRTVFFSQDSSLNSLTLEIKARLR